MKKQITKIVVHQTSKITALMYFVLSAIFCIPMGIALMVTSNIENGLYWFIMPIFYLIFTYVLMAVMSWLYNVLAKAVGGMEFEIEDSVDSKEV